MGKVRRSALRALDLLANVFVNRTSNKLSVSWRPSRCAARTSTSHGGQASRQLTRMPHQDLRRVHLQGQEVQREERDGRWRGLLRDQGALRAVVLDSTES